VTTAAAVGSGFRFLRSTGSLCATCKRGLEAEIVREGEAVFLRKSCPQHGAQRVLLSPDADWYEATEAQAALLSPPAARQPVSQGCPFDCGPCAGHQQAVELPIVPITSACNLDCPICYTHNKNQGAYHMSQAQLDAILDHLARAAPARRLINLTGGEPTQHPEFLQLVQRCAAAGIHRVTISTHGLRFLKDEWLLPLLAGLDARVVLSFDSFEAGANRQLLGGDLLAGKLRVLELLERHRVNTTLLPVLARGHNDHELGAFVRLALQRDFIRSLELHPMTFTGQGGVQFDRAARYTTWEVLRDIQEQTQDQISVQTGVRLRITDFVPAPVAHPLCYLVTYLMRLPGGAWLPFPRFMTPAQLRTLLGPSLYLEPSAELESTLADIINRLWADEIPCDDRAEVLAALRGLADRLFDPDIDAAERLRRAEAETKAIYVHTHMDEETFDTDRLRQCPVGIREPDGRNIPSCAYNVLYRERDARFLASPAPALVTLGRGRL
jgi:7,8-dihydro-6-hydroxymethylpterin dimethyltransferase